MKIKIAIALFGMISLAGCYYDNEEDLYGACETGSVTYSQTVTSLLRNYACLNCHNAPQSNGAPFSLATYADIKAQVDSNRLYGAIHHDNGFAPMPQNAPQMSACDIKKIRAWIDAGAPNN